MLFFQLVLNQKVFYPFLKKQRGILVILVLGSSILKVFL